MQMTSHNKGRVRLQRYELLDPLLDLNLTADRRYLPPGTASVLIGVDNSRIGRLVSSNPRKPLGVSSPNTDNIVTASESEFQGRFTSIFQDEFNLLDYSETSDADDLVIAPSGFENLLSWNSDMEGGIIVVEGLANVPFFYGYISNYDDFDGLTFTNSLISAIDTGATEVAGYEFTILYEKYYDKRGIWFADGRRIFLLNNGSITKYIDLGTNDALAQEWFGSRISSGMFMFVCPKYPPRIVKLNDPPVGAQKTMIVGATAGSEVDCDTATEYATATSYADDGASGTVRTTIMTDDLYVSETGTLLKTNCLKVEYDTGFAALTVGDSVVLRVGTVTAAGNLAIVPYTDANSVSATLTNQVFVPAVTAGLDISFPLSQTFIDALGEQATDGWHLRITAYDDEGTQVAISEVDYKTKTTDISATTSSVAAAVTTPWGSAASGDTIEWIEGNNAGETRTLNSASSNSLGWATVLGSATATGDSFRIIYANPSDDLTRYAGIASVDNGLDKAEYKVTMVAAAGGSITGPGEYRVRIRQKDSVTGAVSSFVDVAQSATLVSEDFHISAAASDKITITINASGTGVMVPNYPRATHYEVYRTEQAGTTFYLDRTVFIDRDGDDLATTIVLTQDDVDLAFNTALTSDDLTLGGLPPIGKRVASIAGVTLIAGKADDGHVDPAFNATGSTTTTVDWPVVTDDETVYPSSLTSVQPESFNISDKRRLSNSGDTFQNFAVAGDVTVAVMKEGAHKIAVSGSALVITVIGEHGIGTPWPNSVIGIGQFAVWATPSGVKIYDTKYDVETGMLDYLTSKSGETMQFWLKEAFDNSDDVYCGYDNRNDVLRIRRVASDATCKAMQYSFKTNTWSEQDNDFGTFYASSLYADSTALETPALYTVTTEGAVFDTNDPTTASHTYDSYLVTDTLASGTHTITTTSIEIDSPAGASQFVASMLGDTVRFSSSTASVEGAIRRITVVTIGATHKITFTPAVAALANGDVFVIGQNHFKVRLAPFLGTGAGTVKTVHSASVHALAGSRHADNSKFAEPPTTKITTRAYRDFHDTAISEKSDDISIGSIAGDTLVDENRHSAVECQGNAIELEFESVDARTELSIIHLGVDLVEEGVEYADTSTTSGAS